MSTEEKICVRHAVQGDAEVIIAFNTAMALETEGKALDLQAATCGVHALFDKPAYGFYIVAEGGSGIVGSLMVTTEWSDWRNGVFWWIQSVYIRPEFRRRGIYRSLYTFVRELAQREPNVCGCRLYVEQENISAQDAYRRLGMQESHYKMFEENL
jgi:ribosomal protein S18 acetylase RimI-like enzyme